MPKLASTTMALVLGIGAVIPDPPQTGAVVLMPWDSPAGAELAAREAARELPESAWVSLPQGLLSAVMLGSIAYCVGTVRRWREEEEASLNDA